ncbi:MULTISPECIES: SPOR domain-containing protein [unclassified Arcicella]|uniref:SPOR domain-containing protein n=1 Tax=unclassified Arcicella TaxID=2644986 RepID=UPI00285DA4E2|nr:MULTISPECIES: SPOR domain-containing protein [unclassified Arcicella]MDR6560374.1 putative lipase involved disintegration of autophagic bodies [Arcicella sp. BE51]MDR6810020.1 putative lipase involved disintegration of autophagic bodies [Arcicella sp. BE140]MDR6821369.1 putative lipase involved disintegration of autophagic bodies [Arcicella sp. BE139]
MQRFLSICLYIFLVILSACSSKVVSSKGSSSGSANSKTSHKKLDKIYEEDLSQYLPKYKKLNEAGDTLSDDKNKSKKGYLTEEPMHINKKLDAILDTISVRNKGVRYANGFRIQIYVGNDRKAADDAKIYTYQTYPEIFPYLSYQQPIYKVKIGDFLNRMDAERYFVNIKESYPSAMILPDRVEIKRGILVK